MASTSGEVPSHDSLLDQFCSVTGSDRDKALKLLEVCGWNVEMAINMHVDSDVSSNEITQDSYSTSPVMDENLSSTDSDGVRAPIPPSRGVLVNEEYPTRLGFGRRRHRVRTVFDGFRDFQAEARWQEELNTESLDPNASKRRKTLEDLFRPPLDLLHRGSFESARYAGQISNKWLLVNIQDPQEFACQVLNRDVWSSKAVKSIVSEHFIFWQVYSSSEEGQRYMQFYKPVTFPYIAIIDPRTGENLAVWNQVDSKAFCDVIISFLSKHVVTDGSLPLPQINHARNLIDLSEEEQFKTALEASLKETHVAINEDDSSSSELETFESDSESIQRDDSESVTHGNVTNDTKTTIEHQHEDMSNLENWKAYLGLEEDEKANLIIRLPDGKRKALTWPSSTKMKALILYSESLGFHQEKYELVTNFPRKNLSDLPLDKTLKELGLYPREMVIIQLKDSV